MSVLVSGSGGDNDPKKGSNPVKLWSLLVPSVETTIQASLDGKGNFKDIVLNSSLFDFLSKEGREILAKALTDNILKLSKSANPNETGGGGTYRAPI
jgi:hypothetical protein